MTLDDYKDQVRTDILTEAKYNKGNYDSLDDFKEDCWTSDAITGNGSGSYTCNAYEAEENIAHVLFDPDVEAMFGEYGYDHIPVEKGAEWIDVSIRCFLLDEIFDAYESEIKTALGLEDE